MCVGRDGKKKDDSKPCHSFSATRVFNSFDGIEIEDSGALSQLTFFNVSEGDYGNYTCVAINKLGSANASIILFGEYSVEMVLYMFYASKGLSKAV